MPFLQLKVNFGISDSQALIDILDNENETKTAAAARSYCASSLSFHVRGAAIAALVKDGSAQSWILHSSEDVQHQVFLAIDSSSEVVEFATWLQQTKRDYISAARIWKLLSMNATRETKTQWMRNALEALKYVPAGTDRVAANLEAQIYYRILTFGDSQTEKDDAARWFAQLVDDDSRMEMLDPNIVPYVCGAVGTIFLGFTNTRFESAFSISA